MTAPDPAAIAASLRRSIKTTELIGHVEALLAKASRYKSDMGAVNWGDLGVCDVEYRLSMISPVAEPYFFVIVGEADPHCALVDWLNARIDRDRFLNAYVECEW